MISILLSLTNNNTYLDSYVSLKNHLVGVVFTIPRRIREVIYIFCQMQSLGRWFKSRRPHILFWEIFKICIENHKLDFISIKYWKKSWKHRIFINKCRFISIWLVLKKCISYKNKADRWIQMKKSINNDFLMKNTSRY